MREVNCGVRNGSEGTFENSPAFQRRDRITNRISPEGTADFPQPGVQSSSWRNFIKLSRPVGTR
jgi:hypothetical protein